MDQIMNAFKGKRKGKFSIWIRSVTNSAVNVKVNLYMNQIINAFKGKFLYELDHEHIQR